MLHRSFAELLQQNAEAVALEVSSIGLDQGRVNGVHFDIAVLTNLTRDHLDYHGDMAHYAKAKAALFDHEQLRHAVLNLDDPFGVHEARRLSGRGIEVIGYSLQADIATQNIPVDRLVVAENIRNTPMGQRLTVRCQGQAFELTVSLVGEFNIANLLAVIAVLIASEIHLEEAVAVAARLSPPSGRMQTLGGMGEPLVIVDYAHSPDALEKVLTAVRATVASRGGKLVCVFGCGGDRDPGKRPLMGQVACHHADKVVLTNDNPRSEDPSLILDEIAAGVCCDECAQVIVSRVPDRAQAIRQSIIEAGMDDVVVLAGKGHETYQEVHGERAPFSDVDEARRALAARFAPQGI
jgi:UDP-N-acetylmuramoyl-L-alanyl-D-glutamate--2,6-diaminopimelate ligase